MLGLDIRLFEMLDVAVKSIFKCKYCVVNTLVFMFINVRAKRKKRATTTN